MVVCSTEHIILFVYVDTFHGKLFIWVFVGIWRIIIAVIYHFFYGLILYFNMMQLLVFLGRENLRFNLSGFFLSFYAW